ncbi:hypothetical protein KI387_021102 [Taxus chinensis]|uniref:Uncharacterized protein n=1 Tax=Taxus chinensis TaxID=29808 RepID=A0AA38GCF3_TAXCH|nr:hypothetical protein KI387_021102 [Taxus chinensis]
MGNYLSYFKNSEEICPKNEMLDMVFSIAGGTNYNFAAGHGLFIQTIANPVENVIDQFKFVKDSNDVDNLINAINALLQSKITQKNEQDKTKEEGTSKITSWTSFIKSGSTFLKFAVTILRQNRHNKEDFSHSIAATKIVSDILDKLGNIHWMVGGLSIIAYLLQKINKVSKNHSECLQLLKYMVDLTDHIKKLRVKIPEQGENLKNVVLIIVEECISRCGDMALQRIYAYPFLPNRHHCPPTFRL